MSNSKSHNTVRWLMESAIMIAIGTMLSEFPKIDFPLGGGLTILILIHLCRCRRATLWIFGR